MGLVPDCPDLVLVHELFLARCSGAPSGPPDCEMNQTSVDKIYDPICPYETKSYCVAGGHNWIGCVDHNGVWSRWFQYMCHKFRYSSDIEDVVSNPEDYQLFLNVSDYGGSPELANASSYDGQEGYKVFYTVGYSSFHTMCIMGVKVYRFKEAELCMECFSISGHASACGKFAEYTLTHISSSQDSCGGSIITDRQVHISYVGSSIDVSGPNVVMASTIHPVTFSVYVSYMNCWSGNVVVSIEGVDDTEHDDLCTTSVSSSIRCECDETKPIYSGGEGGAPPYIELELPFTCCDYVPKDFIAWSDGWNMRQLVPPNER